MPEAAQDYVDVSGIEKGTEKMPAMDSPAPTTPGQQPSPSQSEAESLREQQQLWSRLNEIQQKRIKAAEDAIAAREEESKQAVPLRAELQKSLEARGKELEQPLPQMPSIPPPPQGQPINKDTAMTMASIGMLIAGLGGMGSKSTGRAMIGAATGLLNGFYTGRYDQAAVAEKQWKDLFDYQMGLYKMQIDVFNATMQKSGLSLENKVEQYKLAMAPFQDATQRAEMAEADYDKLFTEQTKLTEVMGKLQETRNGLKLPIERQRWETSARAKGYPNFDAAPPQVQKQIQDDVATQRAEAYGQVRAEAIPVARQPLYVTNTGDIPKRAPRTTTEAENRGLVALATPLERNSLLGAKRVIGIQEQIRQIAPRILAKYRNQRLQDILDVQGNRLVIKSRIAAGDPDMGKFVAYLTDYTMSFPIAMGMAAGREGPKLLEVLEPGIPNMRDSIESAMGKLDANFQSVKLGWQARGIDLTPPGTQESASGMPPPGSNIIDFTTLKK